MSRPLIALTTDFGHDSPYVAQMKGIILGIAPEAALIDVTHSIPPQDILAGALCLRDVSAAFPSGAIHLAVVDPGVGTDRPLVHATINGRHYLAPDNGLLSLVAGERSRMYYLAERRFWREPVAATFHGRDILAPVAARIGLGLDPTSLGPPCAALAQLAWLEPTITATSARGEIVALDNFGNLITNIARRHLPPGRDTRVRVAGEEIPRISTTYGEHPPGSLVALFGSGGYLEIAIVNGDAAKQCALARGAAVEVCWS